MSVSRSLIAAALGLCMVPAHAISFDCVPPVFPSKPVSQEEIRRVDQQVKAWNVCYAAFSARYKSIDATRQDHEVATELEKWTATLRAAAPVQRHAPDAADRRRVEEVMMRQAERTPAMYTRDRR